MTKVVIIGAGIGGLACGLACRQEGLEVTILERAAKLLPIGAGIQIPPNAACTAARLGILDGVLDRGTALDALSYRRYDNGKILLRKNKGRGDRPAVEHPWIVIHRADYLDVLEKAAQEAGVDFQFNTEVAGIDFKDTLVQLTSGETVKGDVIVAADGLWSNSRQQMLPQHGTPRESGDLAYRGTFTREKLEALNDPRINELCSRKEVTVWFGPRGHAVFYPLKSATEFNLVLIRPDDLPENVKTLPGDIDEMRANFHGWDEILNKIISCIPSVLKWKLCTFEELPTWVKGNVTLLGDACHPTLPYQAQGAAMALEDGAVLGKLLGRVNQLPPSMRKQENTVERALHMFEALRKERTSIIVRGSKDNQIWYHLVDGEAQQQRDQAMEAYSRGQEWPRWSKLSKAYDKSLFDFDAVKQCEEAFDDTFISEL